MRRWIKSMAEKDSAFSHGEVIGQVVQLDGEVDVFHCHAFGHLELDGGKIEDGFDTRADEAQGRHLRPGGGGGDDPDLHAFLSDHRLQVVDGVDGLAAGQPPAYLGRVDIEDRHELVALADKILMRQERRAQVPDPHQSHLPDLVEAQDAPDLEEQLLDEIAHPPDAELTEVSQVLADLGRVDAALLGQFVRGDDFHPFLGQGLKIPGVNGQTGNGGRGNLGEFHG